MDASQRQHLESLLQANIRRLHALEQQAAQLGLDMPPHIRTEIDDLQSKIAHLTAQLGVAPLILPAPVPDFVGRADEMKILIQAFETARIGGTVAICGIRGMGGIGKTQLALALAQQLAPDFPDGQVLLNLRGPRGPVPPQYALQSVIRAFNPIVLLPDDLSQLQAMYHTTLRGKHVLILADDAHDANQVGPLIPPSGCALLITSRLRFVLPGMTALDLEALSAEAARVLLHSICPRIGPTADLLAQRCGYLPLALRVSAAVLANDDTRSVQEYLAQLLDTRTRLAYLREPDDPELDVAAALELSYTALDTATQLVLCQLTVFPSSFDRDAAKVVALVSGADGETRLGLLRRHSLLEWDAGTERLHLHDLVRAFALSQLSDAEQRQAAQRHAAYYLTLIETIEQRLHGPEQRAWLDTLEREHANLRVAMEWADTTDDLSTLARIAGSLWWFWNIRGYAREGMRRLERVLGQPERIPPGPRARALLGAAWLSYTLGDQRRGAQLGTQALSLLRALGDRSGSGWSLILLGRITRHQDLDRATAQFKAALVLFQQANDTRGVARALNVLGSIARKQHDTAHASQLYQQSLELFQRVGDKWGVARSRISLGYVRWTSGDEAEAIQLWEVGIRLYRELGYQHGMADALHNVGHVTLRRGDAQRAFAYFQESLKLSRTLDSKDLMVGCLIGLACIATGRGMVERALRWFAIAATTAQQEGMKAAHVKRTGLVQCLAMLRNQLDPHTFQALWTEGRALPLDVGVDEALRMED